MLANILIVLGLASPGADKDPCLLPAWAVDTPTAVSCDVSDAALRSRFGRNRTGIVFKRSAHNSSGYSLVYATTSSGENAKAAAMLAGAFGGYVVAKDKVVGVGWESNLKTFGLDPDAAPVGAVVSLIKTTGGAR